MEKKEILIQVEGLSKKFCKDLSTSLWYGVKDLFSNLRGNKEVRLLREKEFWAVKDINFELRRGECLGLIGHNGAGKSTLLKILNGLIKPDSGKVTVKGKVGALIELGAGFNPILTGRENIYNNGAILGFTRKEINQKLEEIIDFAELREFIDMPVQNYSSGMKVRLGFAIAAQMEPDVLIIDEVLAVGDLGFILKCLKTIDNIIPNTALIFVSHNMPMISRICDKIILLKRGETVFQGNVSTGIDLYYNSFAGKTSNLIFTDKSINLEKIEFVKYRKLENNIPQIKWGDDLELYFKFKVHQQFEEVPSFNIIISDKEQRPLAIFDPNKKDILEYNETGFLEFFLSSPTIRLSKGLYTIDVVVLNRNTKGPHFRINSCLTFQVIHEEDVWQPFLLQSDYKCGEGKKVSN